MKKILVLISILVIAALAVIVYLNIPTNKPTDKITTAPTPQESTESSASAVSKISVPEGAYLYKISDGSKVSYVATEKFLTKPEGYVTGTSDQVNGDGWFNPTDGSGFVEAYIDIKTLATDIKKRDEDVQKLFSDTNIRFSANIPSSSVSLGPPFTLDVPGQITINSITKDVVFKVKGVIIESDLSVQGLTTIKMTDFGITPPSLVNVLNVDDNLELNFDIKAERLN